MTKKRTKKPAGLPPEPPPPEHPPEPDHPKGLLLIPPNVAEVAKLVSRDESKYALTSLRVMQTADGYRVEATDGKVLGVAEGTGFDPGKSLPDAPNGTTEVLLPPKEFTKALREGRPHVQVQLGWVTTIQTSKGRVQLEEQDGRWPNIDSAIPKDKGLVEFWVNADLLSRLLDVAGAFHPEGKVLFRFWKHDKPIVVTADTPEQRFLGLVMPLAS